ncbi:hypothetical protein F2Q68_00012436 [Brassica cretica]|uniref:Uncharacterized protein n=1 Tax=Brassica cretica TaxID=69181 RepID=A0A8S9L204_BRACR|nr:hypothetical protein F2Q68_00012436 [Brassica cretica]
MDSLRCLAISRRREPPSSSPLFYLCSPLSLSRRRQYSWRSGGLSSRRNPRSAPGRSRSDGLKLPTGISLRRCRLRRWRVRLVTDSLHALHGVRCGGGRFEAAVVVKATMVVVGTRPVLLCGRVSASRMGSKRK